MTAKIISFERIPDETPRCALCGKPNLVKLLIGVALQGPYICGECLKQATKRLLWEEGDE